MILLEELNAHLNSLLQPALFQDYCPNGLQVQGRKEIDLIATAVSASLETIQAAVSLGAHTLIVHHGIFWNGDNPVIVSSKRDKISLLLKNDLSLIAYHLPLDAHQQLGNNWRAAQEMGWTDLQPFGMSKGIPIGVKGRVPSKDVNEMKLKLEDYYKHSASCAFGGKVKIETAALISGGAYKSISDAAIAGVDCFITGNFDEPAWPLAFEEKINFFAMGHSATERVGPLALSEYLQKQFNIPCRFIDIFNPF